MLLEGKRKVLLTGNQAIARGFYEAGGLVVFKRANCDFAFIRSLGNINGLFFSYRF